VNCREFQESISAAVDRYLKGGEWRLFEEHASKCPHCRDEYEDELQTKTLIHRRIKIVQTPEALAASIVGQLGREESSMELLRRPWSDIIGVLFARPLLIASVGIAVVVLIITQPAVRFWETSSEPAADTDIIRQSLANYRAMLTGDIKPQLVSSEPANLKEFFAGKTHFTIHVPEMKECTLLGGSLNDLGGEKVAHVMYRRDSGIVYVYQVCREMAMKGEKLSLSGNVRDELQRRGWFTKTLPNGDALVLWIRGGTLCTAVARMSSSDLVATLQSEENNKPW
jgi:hypothetical protein